MQSLPIIRCTVCACAVQKRTERGEAVVGESSTVLDCRGQGQFYAKGPARGLKKFESHFNFSGAFEGMCCFCALHKGWSGVSFASVGCYLCKKHKFQIREFSRLKGPDNAVGSPVNWAGLPDSVIDHILKMVVGDKTLRLFNRGN